MAVFPVYNILIAPDASVYFKTDYYKRVTGKNPVQDERVILIVAKEDLEREEFTSDSFYPIGLSGTIAEISSNGYIMIRTKNRVNIDDLAVYRDHTIDLSVSRRRDIEDLDAEEGARKLRGVKAALYDFSQNFRWGEAARSSIASWTNLAEIAVVMSPWLQNTNAERYAVLAEDSLQKRTEMLERMIYENIAQTKVNHEAESAQEQDHQKLYRENAIRKQMEYLQKELDELHPEEVTDLRKLELKVEESGMNETAMKEAQKVLSRLKHEGQNGTEAGMLYDYLDFLAGLPWKKEKPKDIALDEAATVLDEDHFGLKKVKDRIVQQIAVMSLKRQQAGSILLFVGAPGTGKTSIGQSIAKALQREYVRVSLGGVRDEADIRGHRRTYIGAMPGRIMDGIQKAGVSNPVMVLDEVDKLYASYNGDPASALLEVLDPEQNSTFTDHYLNVPYDLSDVLFVCTANSLDTIPEPLLNRMEVIQFQGYTPTEKLQIAKRHLLPKAMKSVGIKPEQLSVTDEAIETIITDYTREAGVRGLKKRMDTLCRTAAVRIVRSEGERLDVTPEDLREVLDMHPLHHQGAGKDEARRRDGSCLDAGRRRDPLHRDDVHARHRQAHHHGPARQRDEGERPDRRESRQDLLPRQGGALRKERPAHPCARRRDAEGRSLGGHHAHDGDRIARQRQAHLPGHRHDRRGQPARRREPDRRTAGEAHGGAARRRAAGVHPEGQCRGSARRGRGGQVRAEDHARGADHRCAQGARHQGQGARAPRAEKEDSGKNRISLTNGAARKRPILVVAVGEGLDPPARQAQEHDKN